MSHDKISAAARKRMAETGEPYAAARRAVIKEHQAAGRQIPPSDAQWFAISYSRGRDRQDHGLAGHPLAPPRARGKSGVEVGLRRDPGPDGLLQDRHTAAVRAVR